MNTKEEMLNFENEYTLKGYNVIAGMDEAGRGPLAGPVVCACAIMPLDSDKIIEGVNDSKKLTPKKRDELYEKIKNTAVCYSIQEVDNKTIDKINILNATRLGMQNCVKNLKVKPDFVLIDYIVGLELDVPNIPIVKGDAKSYSIACASILAKVYRDRLMEELDNKYPEYNFKKHKGYGTKEHIESLKKFGKCEIHRNTFIKHFIGENND